MIRWGFEVCLLYVSDFRDSIREERHVALSRNPRLWLAERLRLKPWFLPRKQYQQPFSRDARISRVYLSEMANKGGRGNSHQRVARKSVFREKGDLSPVDHSKESEKTPITSEQDIPFFVSVLSLAAAIFFFVLQANGVDVNWEISGSIYILCALVGVWTTLQHALPGRSWNIRYGVASLLFVVCVVLGSIGTITQYKKEHTPDKQGELLKIVKTLDKQQKYLDEFPLGYAIFDVDLLSGAVDPLQAHQGMGTYILDFRKVAVLRNDENIEIRLPDVVKDGKTVVTGAIISGNRPTMLTSGAGYVFGDESKMIMVTGRVLSDRDNRLVWILGMHELFMPKT